MDLDQFKHLLEIARAAGVAEFTWQGCTVKFSAALTPAYNPPEPSPEQRRAALAAMLKTDNDDKDADLLWST